METYGTDFHTVAALRKGIKETADIMNLAGAPFDSSDNDVEPVPLKSHYPTREPVVHREFTSNSGEEPVPELLDDHAHLLKVHSSITSTNVTAHLGEPNDVSDLKSVLSRQKRYFTTSKPDYVHPALASSFIDDYHKALSRHSPKQRHANKV